MKFSAIAIASLLAAASTEAHMVDDGKLRGFFSGAGSAMFSEAQIVDSVIALLPTSSQEDWISDATSDIALARNNINSTVLASGIKAVIIGTATYDTQYVNMNKTIDLFSERVGPNGKVDVLNVAFDFQNLSADEEEQFHKSNEQLIDDADIIVVGGGNTLFAVDRWMYLGYVRPALERAMDRGAIISGGSAGAICWFSGGHSDSCDPSSYVDSRLDAANYSFYNNEQYEELLICPSPFTLEEQQDEGDNGNWDYINIPGVDFLTGILCPHHDKVQSNGKLRSNDFDQMLLQMAHTVLTESTESLQNKTITMKSIIGIGVDNYAALAVEGDDYFVTSLNDTKGSVGYDSEGLPVFSVDDEGNQEGVPGIWIKRVVPINENGDLSDIANYEISYTLLKSEGKLLLDLYGAEDAAAMEQLANGLTYIQSINVEVQDELQRCRSQNPSDCKEPAVVEDEDDQEEEEDNTTDVDASEGNWHSFTNVVLTMCVAVPLMFI